MVNFQYLEFMLRGAIKKFESLIRDQVSEALSYPYSQKKIDKMALGSLADQYSIYTSDKDFKTEVDVVISARNKLAHAMFMKVDFRLDNSEETLIKEVDEIFAASEKAADLAEDVIMKMQHIYYDHFSNEWVYP